MRQLGDLRRFMQQPALNVIGILGAAGATKIGYAGLAAEAIVTLVMIYLGVRLLSVMARKLVFTKPSVADGRAEATS